ncbi:MAG: hypothetical protein RBG13Loki_2539 [Promethearchaeota archaeon CR_4]|nr:MAG: hypothetical protein RBG13Loki_2539 [Candidatus Lokiarchaeota archaeon CR_4]
MKKYDDEGQTLRCFPTKCRSCGKIVLYWENKKGSKVFFDYPVAEKFRQHFCKIPKKIVEEKSNLERQFEIHHQEKFQCPICGKIFDKESDLTQHLKDRKRNDPVYRDFFQKILLFDFLEGDSKTSGENAKVKWTFGNSTQFGKIIMRKDKKRKHLKNI